MDTNAILISGLATWHRFYDPSDKSYTQLTVAIDASLGEKLFVDVSISGQNQLRSSRLKYILDRLGSERSTPCIVEGTFCQRTKKDGIILDCVKLPLSGFSLELGITSTPINMYTIRGTVTKQTDNAVLIQTAFYNPKKQVWSYRLIPVVAPSLLEIGRELLSQRVVWVGKIQTRTPTGKKKLFIRPDTLVVTS